MDITKRLRNPVRHGSESQDQAKARHFRERHEAANEIERMRDALEWISNNGPEDAWELRDKAREALKPNVEVRGEP